jgi:hypothetical protein
MIIDHLSPKYFTWGAARKLANAKTAKHNPEE